MKEENFLKNTTFLTNIERNDKKDLGADAQGSTFKMLSLVLKYNDIWLDSLLYVNCSNEDGDTLYINICVRWHLYTTEISLWYTI